MKPTDIEAQFNRIYDLTVRETAAYLYAKSRRPEDVSDLLQETFLQLYQMLKGSSGTPIHSPHGLVRTFANRTLYAYYQTELPLPLAYPNESDRSFNESSIDQLEDEIVHELDEQISRSVTLQQLLDTLKVEAPLDWRIIILYYDYDLKLRTIAEYLEVPLSTVKSRLYRCLKRLRSDLTAPNETKEA